MREERGGGEGELTFISLAGRLSSSVFFCGSLEASSARALRTRVLATMRSGAEVPMVTAIPGRPMINDVTRVTRGLSLSLFSAALCVVADGGSKGKTRRYMDSIKPSACCFSISILCHILPPCLTTRARCDGLRRGRDSPPRRSGCPRPLQSVLGESRPYGVEHGKTAPRPQPRLQPHPRHPSRAGQPGDAQVRPPTSLHFQIAYSFLESSTFRSTKLSNFPPPLEN